MSARLWALLTLATGAGVLAVAVLFAALPEVKAAAPCMSAGAIVRFELADSVRDLDAVFGPRGGACRPAMVAAMNAINHLDMIAFIPFYTAFFCCAAALAGGGEGRPLVLAAFVAALIAAAGDVLETRTLLAITASFRDAPDLFVRSLAGAWTKFLALAVYGVLIATLGWTMRPRRSALAAAALAPVLGAGLLAIDEARFWAVSGAALALLWAGLMAAAVAALIRPRPAPDAAP